jgi:hypothetical protein
MPDKAKGKGKAKAGKALKPARKKVAEAAPPASTAPPKPAL